jgi:hypothetical protein
MVIQRIQNEDVNDTRISLLGHNLKIVTENDLLRNVFVIGLCIKLNKMQYKKINKSTIQFLLK